ncbi:MAG: hypothetical protein Fur009_4100 [Candidatus Microgenomates bacterium]
MLSFYLLGAKKLFSFLKKVLFVITVYFIIISLFIKFSNKDNQINNKNFQKKIVDYQKEIDHSLINNPDLNKTEYGKYIIETYKISNCVIFGNLCPKNNKNNYTNSLFSKINNIFIYIFSIRPASFVYWASNSIEKASLIPKSFAIDNAPATGIGFQSLKFLYLLWENFRNLSFLIITLVLVTIGFMIMFRTKINPQTVISIENALPKIVIAMILITFSYPIVGLMIDLMYISLPIVAGLFKNILYMPIDEFSRGLDLNFLIPKFSPSGLFFGNLITSLINNMIKLIPILNGFHNKTILDLLFDQFINHSVFGIVFDWFNLNLYIKTINDIFSGTFLLGESFFGQLFSPVFKFVMSFLTLFLAAVIYNPIGTYLSDKLGDIGGGQGLNLAKIVISAIVGFVIVNLLIIFITVLGLLFLTFRILFFLLSCLFNLIVYTIIAPLYLLLEAVPGKSSFSSWIKNIIGNLAVFPVFLFIILLQRSLYTFMIINPDNQVLTLPGLNFSNVPLFFASILNIYILLMIPDLLKLVKAAIIGKEGLSIPASAGILFGGVGAAGGSIMGFANQFYYLKTGYDTFFGKRLPPGGETGKTEPDKDKNIFREKISDIAKKIIPK